MTVDSTLNYPVASALFLCLCKVEEALWSLRQCSVQILQSILSVSEMYGVSANVATCFASWVIIRGI